MQHVYVVFTYRLDGTLGGAATHDFGRCLAKGETVAYGGVDCVVDDLDEASEPPTVYLRPT